MVLALVRVLIDGEKLCGFRVSTIWRFDHWKIYKALRRVQGELQGVTGPVVSTPASRRLEVAQRRQRLLDLSALVRLLVRALVESVPNYRPTRAAHSTV